MLKKLGLTVVLAGILGGCNLLPRKAGLEILSYPSAKVYLEGKEVGVTPYKNTMLLPGVVKVKLISGESVWQKEVPLSNNANTIVNWEFGTKERGGGYVLHVETTGDKSRAELLVNSKPEKAAVAVDGETKALSPVVIPDLGEGDKQVTVSFPSYKTINIFVKSLKGYQLVLETELREGGDERTEEVVPEATPTDETRVMVTIKETETGWLRVRKDPSNTSEEVGKVNPGETFPLLEERNGWYRIESGWILAKYADKSE